jgi:hypothetical protein
MKLSLGLEILAETPLGPLAWIATSCIYNTWAGQAQTHNMFVVVAAKIVASKAAGEYRRRSISLRFSGLTASIKALPVLFLSAHVASKRDSINELFICLIRIRDSNIPGQIEAYYSLITIVCRRLKLSTTEGSREPYWAPCDPARIFQDDFLRAAVSDHLLWGQGLSRTVWVHSRGNASTDSIGDSHFSRT